MPNEPTIKNTAAILDPVREIYHLEQRIQLLVREIENHRAAQERATEIARIDMNTRLEGMNEFRRQIEQTSSQFRTKAEAYADQRRIELQFDGVEVRMRALERTIYMAGGAVAIITLLLRFIKV